MIWNWQKPEWPHFKFEQELLAAWESKFLIASGYLTGSMAHIPDEDKAALTIETMSEEALKTSEIEGEYLNRDSLQSSIRKNLGLTSENRKVKPAEQGIADMMTELYQNFSSSLTHQTLFDWHNMLMQGNKNVGSIGCYRTHIDPMQVVSRALHKPKVHFEAPPSDKVGYEMNQFIEWFNDTVPDGKSPLPALTRAGIAHLYFVCIHPFEDGNGRIGRALIVKALSQNLEQPVLTALSYTIQKSRKLYYEALEENNKSLAITPWLIYFAKTVIDAQSYTQHLINFLIEKGKLYDRIKGKLNKRQEKVLARMFRDGPDSFPLGLSAEKYISITSTSRATATRDLQDMVDKDVFIRTGELKSTRYYLNILKPEPYFSKS
jgi:Fic family protein